MSRQLEIVKEDSAGQPVWSYPGRLIRETTHSRIVEAFFDRSSVGLELFSLEAGDRMVEHFFDDRWYNIFEIFDNAGRRKGWYCNLTRPAEFSSGAIHQQDLALDLVVSPLGRTQELDWDEFKALDLSPAERRQALAGLAELRRMVKDRVEPFDSIHL